MGEQKSNGGNPKRRDDTTREATPTSWGTREVTRRAIVVGTGKENDVRSTGPPSQQAPASTMTMGSSGRKDQSDDASKPAFNLSKLKAKLVGLRAARQKHSANRKRTKPDTPPQVKFLHSKFRQVFQPFSKNKEKYSHRNATKSTAHKHVSKQQEQ